MEQEQWVERGFWCVLSGLKPREDGVVVKLFGQPACLKNWSRCGKVTEMVEMILIDCPENSRKVERE